MASRRLLAAAVAALGVSVSMGLAGCTPWKSQVRPTPQAEPPELLDVEQGAAAEKQLLKGFFKPTRLPGGWSAEANEIEKHLGVR